MPETKFQNRRAVSIENRDVRVTVLVEGGHIAEITDKASGVNPLWVPPWPSIEPSTYDPAKHPEYGGDSESKLLAGIMGHNLCLDIFGGPSEEEAAAGLSVHGEGSVVPNDITLEGSSLVAKAVFPEAQLRFERKIELAPESRVVLISEVVENLAGTDRPVGWTQHVTLGPPFLENGVTEFRATATRSKVFESDFSDGHGYMKIGAEFDWPNVPHKNGGFVDLRVFTEQRVSAGFTTHLMDPAQENAYFLAYSPRSRMLHGYIWKRADFPWLGIWEESNCREHPPWNGITVTRGMEFGASPMPETRRQMIERGGLFGVPGFRWIPARSKVSVQYCAFIAPAEKIPESAAWAGGHEVQWS